MQNTLLPFLPVIAPLLLLALAARLLLKKEKGLSHSKQWAEAVGWTGVALSLTSIPVLALYGPIEKSLIVFYGLGLSLRIDPLSVTMLIMISILAVVIIRFTRNYLDADSREWVFLTRLLTTIAAVELLVLSGNLFQLALFWIITSVCLCHLLLFYPDRPRALTAARKKLIVARMGDLCLLTACLLLYWATGTGNLSELFASVQASGALSTPLTWASILLVMAAVLKSAQFPTHSWLIEVVETPTPVSALLHAGLLNAGPFLIVRLSHLMEASTSASLLLIVFGGCTALFASVVFLTQPTIKVALGYSSIAHMGFMLLICGFGVYSAAILHLVAHSFYKAHAFLSSGSVVERVKIKKIGMPKRIRNPWRIALAFASAMAIYVLCCYLWGIDPAGEFNLMATGAIIVMGISQILVPPLDSAGGRNVVWRAMAMAALVALSFFSLEHLASSLLASQIPETEGHSPVVMIATIIVISCYAVVIWIQSQAKTPQAGSFGHRLGIHLRNGCYTNILFDRLVGSLTTIPNTTRQATLPKAPSSVRSFTERR